MLQQSAADGELAAALCCEDNACVKWLPGVAVEKRLVMVTKAGRFLFQNQLVYCQIKAYIFLTIEHYESLSTN